jgi:hypothetical protein
VNGLPGVIPLIGKIVDLGVAIVARSNAVVCLGGQDLIGLTLAVGPSLFVIPRLEETAAAAATEIVGAVGRHVNEILFTHNGSDNKPQIFGNGIPKTLANNLAGILNRELNFAILIPVGIDLESSFTNPLGVIFINIFDFKFMVDVEFIQSGPD